MAVTTFRRFLNSFEIKGTGCWLWKGNLGNGGYGLLWDRERNGRLLAHRWSFEHFIGPIPAGAVVLHTCDQPACVNPEHLTVGSQADNIADCVTKGRRAKKLTARHRERISRSLKNR